jgi:hypothetical protein
VQEFFQTGLALIGCGTYVLSTYTQLTVLTDIDFSLTTFFLIDFLLLFTIAESKLRYFGNPFAILDVFVIVFSIVYLVLNLIFPSSLTLIGIFRLVMSLRILRFQRLLKWFSAVQ